MSLDFSYQHVEAKILANHTRSQDEYLDDFHIHNNYEIYYFIEGDVDFFVNDSCYHLEKGNVLIFNSQDVHKAVTLTTDIPYERIVIHFNPNTFRQMSTDITNLLACFEDTRDCKSNIMTLNLTQCEYFESIVEPMIFHLKGNDYGSDILPYVLLIQILVLINEAYAYNEHKEKSIMSPQVLATIGYINAHLTDDLSLDKIAQDLSISKYHLSHTFRKHTGTTIYQYLLVKRIALAKKLLIEGKSVTEACQESGFNDYANFIRTFKNVTGISPGCFGKS